MLASPESPQAIEYANSYVLPWRVLRVESGHELEAELHLSKRGIEPFVPTYKALKRFHDRRPVTILRALFTGYAIAAWRECDRALVLSCPRVIDVLTFGTKQAELDDDEMARLRTLGGMEGVEPWQSIPQGARIRVVSGPLAGTFGTLMGRNGDTSIIVEIQMLSRMVRTKLDGWDIEKA